MSDSSTSLPPGFRFHPTDEELILHYLSNRAASLPCPVSVIADVDIYKFDPWDLPALAKSGDREWYFFTPRDRKYPNGVRPNRAAGSGYWKATGTDKPIAGKGIRIGVKKALVFYMGRPPKGIKTDWIMHEYRLDRGHARHDKKPIGLRDSSMRLDDWVLCRIYKKSTSHQRSMMNRENTPNGEDAYLSSSPNTGELDCPKLPRPSSLTELFDSVDYSILSQLFDIPNELPGSESQCHFSSNQLPFIGTSNRSNGDSCSIGMLSEMDSPVSVCGIRPRIGEDCSEEGGGSIQSQKKQRNSGIWSNPTNNFGSLQNSSLLNQAFINQQFLNSSLGLL